MILKVKDLELEYCTDCGSTSLVPYRRINKEFTGIKCKNCSSMYWIEHGLVTKLRVTFDKVYDGSKAKIDWVVT